MATPGFVALMKMAREASGRNHPMAFSCWKQDTDFAPGLSKAGETDVVLQIKAGGKLHAITFGHPEQLRVGDVVLAIGADTNWYGNERIRANAIPMKSVSEARR